MLTTNAGRGVSESRVHFVKIIAMTLVQAGPDPTGRTLKGRAMLVLYSGQTYILLLLGPSNCGRSIRTIIALCFVRLCKNYLLKRLKTENLTESGDCASTVGTCTIFDIVSNVVPAKMKMKMCSIPNMDSKDFDDMAKLWRDDPNPPRSLTEHGFSAETLARALLCDLSCQQIKGYLTFFSLEEVRSHINDRVYDSCVLYYAVKKNCPDCVRLCFNFGAQLSVLTSRGHGLMTFLMLNAHRSVINATEVAKVLLARGQDPHEIRSELWENFIRNPVHKDLHPHKKDVPSGLNLTLRYLLWKASHVRKPATRTKQVADANGMSGLLELPYYLIGQDHAAKVVMQRIVSHVMLQKNTPLTMVFAGPSGHGKTEMANVMGKLLGIKAHIVDMTSMQHETDLFGPKAPYQGWEESSPLSIFLQQQDGCRSVVVLDEFEKSTAEVRNALLLPIESGKYIHRQTNAPVDCTKTIWICATNLVDPIVKEFFSTYLFEKDLNTQRQAPFHDLQRQMREAFVSRLGAPMTGRLEVIVPFFPFQPDEQAAIAHKQILAVADRFRGKIDVDTKRFAGRVHLHIEKDGATCRHIAEQGYEVDTGARSIATHVNNLVEMPLADLYQEQEELIADERNKKPLSKYVVELTEVKSLEVRSDGTTVANEWEHR